MIDQPHLLDLFCRWCLTEPLSDNFVVRCIACEPSKDPLILHAGEARVKCSPVRGGQVDALQSVQRRSLRPVISRPLRPAKSR